MNKTITSIIVVLVAVAAIVALVFWRKPAQAPATPDGSETPVVVGDTTPKLVDVSEKTDIYTISGSYPQFPQASAEFNAQISDLVKRATDDFKKNAQEEYDFRLKNGGDEFLKQFAQGGMFTYSVRAEVVQSNEKYVSVLLRQEGYAGGAHGYHVGSGFNYDVAAKKQLALTDFMTLQQAADASRASLKKQFAAQGDVSTFEGFAIAGTDPGNPDNYKQFTFTDDAVTIYFSEYQVAPYAYGEMKVVVPR